MLVSFIVPVYNGEKTIERCLSSICNLREKNIEIIVVNDGSTDCTKDILENLAQTDKRIKVANIPNGGVSNARNIALKLAKGEYVAFSDCDDVVLSDYNGVLEILERQAFDIIVCDYVHNKENIREDFHRKKLQAGNNNCGLLYEEIALGKFNNIWCNIYKRDIMEQNDLKFDSEMKMGEDAKFNLDYVSLCKSCYYYDKPVYEYIDDNSTSAMHSYKASYLKDHIVLYDRQLDFLNEHQLIKGFEIDDYMVSRIFGVLYYSKDKIEDAIIQKFEKSVLLEKIKNAKLRQNRSRIKKVLIKSGLYKLDVMRNLIIRFISIK